MECISFTDIAQLHNVIKLIDVYPHLVTGDVIYRGKIKLHGTNAGIRLSNGEVAAQSRSKIITPDDDNAGFAAWVETKKYLWENVFPDKEYTVFGEWCGPAIQKGTAINKIPTKIFAVFAILDGSEPYNSVFITEPDEIKKIVFCNGEQDDIYVLPWHGEPFSMNFSQRDSLQTLVDTLNKEVEIVEQCDPWVKDTFGVEGIGEGLVYYPMAGKVVTRKFFGDLVFKAKGEKHKVNKTKTAVQIDPEVAKSVDEFVKMFATEARFEQGYNLLTVPDIKHTGEFLKWVGLDILKESTAELEAANLEWKDVQKAVQEVAKNWYILKMKEISV